MRKQKRISLLARLARLAAFLSPANRAISHSTLSESKLISTRVRKAIAGHATIAARTPQPCAQAWPPAHSTSHRKWTPYHTRQTPGSRPGRRSSRGKFGKALPGRHRQGSAPRRAQQSRPLRCGFFVLGFWRGFFFFFRFFFNFHL